MTPAEIRALAERIAEFLAERAGAITGPGPDAATDPTAERPRPSRPRKNDSQYRPAYDALTAAVRAAAAGRGPSPSGRPRPSSAPGRGESHVVPVAVSNRHVHLSQRDTEQLFGPSHNLSPDRPIKQPGQFAARERVRVVGPRGAIADVRVVGPPRRHTQIELAASDSARIGVDAPVRGSGDTGGTAPIRLEGPAGAVDLSSGAIIAARHLHVSPDDGARFGLGDGGRVTLVVGAGDRRATIHDVLVRMGERHATELHLDTDEARAYGIDRAATATLLTTAGSGRRTRHEGARRVITAGDVDAIAADGRSLSRGPACIVTPAAIDRAKAFGIWRE